VKGKKGKREKGKLTLNWNPGIEIMLHAFSLVRFHASLQLQRSYLFSFLYSLFSTNQSCPFVFNSQ